MNPINALRNPSSLHNSCIELHDFMDGANYDQFFNLIHDNDDPHFDCDQHTNCCLIDNQFSPTTPGDMFGFNANNNTGSDANHCLLNDALFPSFEGEKKEVPEEDVDRRDDSSGTSMTTPSKSKMGKNVNPTRTLVSERRRRGMMKEKLYALRALVPNITKMDKASIVGDALQYVQEVQMQAKKLTAEISGLEASLVGPAQRYQGYNNVGNTTKIQMTNTSQLISKKIIQMDMFQVEERGFYVKLVCNKGEGVAASLYKVLESLIIFNVQNSNLTTAFESLVLTVTLKVKDFELEINLPNLKLWVIGALLNERFELC